MAIGNAERREFRANVNDNIEDIRDEDNYNSDEGFGVSRARIEEDYSRHRAEIERNPESALAEINNMDADGQLMQQIIAESRGISGFFHRLPQGRVASAVKRTLGVVGLNFALRFGVKKALETASGPVVGMIAGGIGGGVWGYKRGKDQTEGADTWMAQLGISTSNRGEMEAMSTQRMIIAMGIMRNAVKEGRVRGNSQVKLEFATKYGVMRRELQRRQNEAREHNGPMDPAMQAIDEALAGATEDTNIIGEMASKSEEVTKAWDTIKKANKAKVVSGTLKGAVIGGVTSGVFGFILDHGVNSAHYAIEWAKDHLGSHNAGMSEAALEAKKDALLNSSGLHAEIGQHATNMDIPAGVENGQVDIASLSPDQLEAYKHLASLQEMAGPDSISGFHGGDLSQFNSLLQNGDFNHLAQFASQHNLDMWTNMPNGEHFGQLLVDHKDVFLKLPPDIQNFIISHPSIAGDMVNFATSGSQDSLSNVLSMVATGAGLASAGGIFIGAHRSQVGADKDIEGAYETMKGAVDKKQSEWTIKQEKDNYTKSTERLIGYVVSFTPAAMADVGYVLPAGRRNEFTVTGIEENGRLIFQPTRTDEAMIRAGGNPFPQLTLRNLLNEDNTLNIDAVTVMRAAPESAPESAYNQSVNRLRGTRVTFDAAVLPAGYAFPRGRDHDFVISDIAGDGTLIFESNEIDRREQIAGRHPHPHINIRNLLNQDESLNFALVHEVHTAETEGVEGAEPDRAAHERFLGRDIEGTIEERVIPGVGVRRVLVGRLIGTTGRNRAFQISNPALADLPIGIPLRVNFSNFEFSGDTPVFDAQISLVEGADNFRVTERFARGTNPEKTSFYQRLRSRFDAGTADNIRIYLPGINREMYRCTGCTPAVGGGGGRTATPLTFQLDLPNGAGTLNLTDADMNAQEIIYLQQT